jgi:transcriptional regulator with XRE-family HTH domain
VSVTVSVPGKHHIKVGARARKTKSGPAQRLRKLREAAGYETAQAAAIAAGVHVATYHHYENGIRPITQRAAILLAQFYKTTPGVILFGERLQSNALVPILGGVGRQGWTKPIGLNDSDGGETSNAVSLQKPISARIRWFSDPQTRRRREGAVFTATTEAPPGVSYEQALRIVSLRIETNDLVPGFLPGEVLYYSPSQPFDPIDTASVHNRRCIVVTADGECGPAIISANGGGSFTMMAIGAVEARTISDPAGIWPVLWTKHPELS